MSDTNNQQHPSHGCIAISRPRGGNNPFSGSPIRHRNYSTIEIYRAIDKGEKHGYPLVHSTGSPLIKVRLTPIQFSELLSSIGQSDGVPVTLEQVNGEKIPEPKIKPVAEKQSEIFIQHVKEDNKRYMELIHKLEDKRRLTNEDIHSLKVFGQNREANIKFFIELLYEQLEVSYSNMVTSFRTMVQNTLERKGLLSLKGKADKFLKQLNNE